MTDPKLLRLWEILLQNLDLPNASVRTLRGMFKQLGDSEGMRGLEYLLNDPEQCELFAKSRGLAVYTLEAVAFRTCLELTHGSTITFH